MDQGRIAPIPRADPVGLRQTLCTVGRVCSGRRGANRAPNGGADRSDTGR
jgi:hypothetical protein